VLLAVSYGSYMDIPASVLICIRATHGGVHHAWVFWTRFTVIALTLGDLYIGDNQRRQRLRVPQRHPPLNMMHMVETMAASLSHATGQFGRVNFTASDSL
jgi:hypothetical protein